MTMHAIGWKLLSEATTRFLWLSSRPPIRKNKLLSFQLKQNFSTPKNKLWPLWYKKRSTTEQGALAGPGKKTPTTDRNCDSARRERNPRNRAKTPHLGQINMRTFHLHLVVLKRQTSLMLLPLEKVERKEADV